MTEKVLKLKHKNEEKEMGCLANEFMNGTKRFDELDMKQLSRFSQFVGTKLKELEKRMNELSYLRICIKYLFTFLGLYVSRKIVTDDG
ncbi:hypothetical protein ACJIZ3_005958 [Penstemon smallii]|uniref:Uncharacterized protein n=1 Tax=Penstemon smallii TaxID=265156 RepID=A0ABD3S6H1_9LAMI